ncbi:uncharacterized protein LOC128745425 [Sabethes cyaneus]|uniref:uncharacterized protein LOC128745425 n=1 Tax=Sabethes cyaneus TaxID=53552 RepID=UPI00237E9786|nr:uncharacterized protein LOC128745425 [Sabethes cyaneus]
MLLGSTSEREVLRLIDSLKEKFELTCLGDVRHFLGIDIRREAGIYKILLKNYIEKLITNHGMEQAKTAKSSMQPGFMKDDNSSAVLEDATKYRSLVEGLLYLAVNTRPDIAECMAILGRKFSNPREADWTAAKRVLKYLKKMVDCSLRLGGYSEQLLVAYSVSDWAGDVCSRKLTSGFVFFFGGVLVSWASHRQTSIVIYGGEVFGAE